MGAALDTVEIEKISFLFIFATETLSCTPYHTNVISNLQHDQDIRLHFCYSHARRGISHQELVCRGRGCSFTHTLQHWAAQTQKHTETSISDNGQEDQKLKSLATPHQR